MKKHGWNDYYEAEMDDLIGRIFTKVTATDETLTMKCADGVFTFWHEQDCCEGVEIESIVGDLNDLVGAPILKAEEATSNETPADYTHEYEPDSQTWTFYKFATIKGYVDVRWFGSSNGYYSESVSIKFTPAVAQE